MGDSLLRKPALASTRDSDQPRAEDAGHARLLFFTGQPGLRARVARQAGERGVHEVSDRLAPRLPDAATGRGSEQRLRPAVDSPRKRGMSDLIWRFQPGLSH